jgi:hypothetical protein
MTIKKRIVLSQGRTITSPNGKIVAMKNHLAQKENKKDVAKTLFL